MAKGSKRKAADSQKRVGKVPAVPVKSVAFPLKPAVHILIIFALGILIYSNTFNVPFVYDDIFSIVNNPAIKDFRYFSDPSLAEREQLKSFYRGRFVGYLTFAVNYNMHALHVAGYHVFNILIHLLNALLVYWLVFLTFRTPYASDHFQKDVLNASATYGLLPLFSALLFVAHPVQTQAVTYVVQRFTSLATLFFLLSFVMYIKARDSESSKKARYACYAVSIISAILAMGTKEIAFTLPVMVFLYEFMFFRGDIKKRIFYLFPLLLTMVIIPLSLTSVLGNSRGTDGIFGELTKIAGSADVSRWDYLNTQFRVIVTYIRLLFLPVNQNVIYDYPIYRTFFTPSVFLSFLFLVTVFCSGIYLLYRSYKSDQTNRCLCRVVAFGIFWFFVTLSVESSIFPIVDVIFEHRLYLPSVGFFMAIMSGILFVQMKLAGRAKGVAKVFMPFMILAVISLSVTVHARNMIWRDEVTLWEDGVRKSPHRALPHYNLGCSYHQIPGRLDDAIREYQTAIHLDSDQVMPHYNLGLAYKKQGRLDEAIREYEIAVKRGPDYPEIHYNIGVAYQEQGRLDDAIKEYRTAIKLKPGYADAHNNLGVAYHKQGHLDDAIKEYQTAIKLEPDHTKARNNLGMAHQK